jgi:hypothetical protein
VRRSFFLAGLLVASALTSACGRSPAASSAEAAAAPSGTLVVVIVTGPDRVPFHPKVARIQRANAQLTTILGHSIQIELDGALLPQGVDGAEDLIAHLVEDVARDIDALSKHDKSALPFAQKNFERLVVRYAPVEAAARAPAQRWRRNAFSAAKLDPSSKTIDIVRAEAQWRSIERGEVSGVLLHAFSTGMDDRYANVLPDAFDVSERRAWFEYHMHGHSSTSSSSSSKRNSTSKDRNVGPVDTLKVRGMVMLATDGGGGSGSGDGDLARDARAWLLAGATSDFAGAYHHNQADIEGASPSSPYRQAETAYINWIKSELPRMSIDERGKIAAHLWVTDFRRDSGERDRFAAYAFPGIDPMAFSFEAVDAWIAAGHPPKQGEASREVPVLFDTVVCPASVETREGQVHFSHIGRCDGSFYQWALANKSREDAFVKGMIARPDVPFAIAAFYNARRSLRQEADYLRFLRRFEATPILWGVGADVHREVVYRPSAELIGESRRLWREVPAARGHVLLWFARHGEGSYHPDSDWPDLVQDKPADEAALSSFLALGWEAFEMLPAAWPGLAKGNRRMAIIQNTARQLLATDIRARPGGKNVSGTLAVIARLLCEDHSTGELAELRSFAQAELPKWPGKGLSDVVEATDPSTCKPKPKAPKPIPAKKTPRRAPGSEGKDPLGS